MYLFSVSESRDQLLMSISNTTCIPLGCTSSLSSLSRVAGGTGCGDTSQTWRRGRKSRSSVEGRSSTVDRERRQTVAQSQSGGVSGLSQVCAGVEGEGGECVWEEGGRG